MQARLLVALTILVTLALLNAPPAQAGIQPIVAAGSFFTALDAGDHEAAVAIVHPDGVATLVRGETYQGPEGISELVQLLAYPGSTTRSFRPTWRATRSLLLLRSPTAASAGARLRSRSRCKGQAAHVPRAGAPGTLRLRGPPSLARRGRLCRAIETFVRSVGPQRSPSECCGPTFSRHVRRRGGTSRRQLQRSIDVQFQAAILAMSPGSLAV